MKLYIGSGEDFPPQSLVQLSEEQQQPRQAQSRVRGSPFWSDCLRWYKQLSEDTSNAGDVGYEAAHPTAYLHSR